MARRKRTRYAMSRSRKNALLGVFFLFLLPLAVLMDRSLLRPLREAVGMAVWASDDRKRFHDKAFTVVEVIDGDTLDIDATGTGGRPTRIRLIGVDTPETRHPTIGKMYFGPEATAFARQQAEGKSVFIRLDTIADERDRYGRLLAYVILPSGDVLNEAIIRQGFGYADLRFKHSESDRYEAMMDAAFTVKEGLWQGVERGQLPAWLQRERPLLLR